MKRRFALGTLAAAALAAALLAAPAALARGDKPAPRKGEFTFALLGHNFPKGEGDAEFRRMLTEASRAEPAFLECYFGSKFL